MGHRNRREEDAPPDGNEPTRGRASPRRQQTAVDAREEGGGGEGERGRVAARPRPAADRVHAVVVFIVVVFIVVVVIVVVVIVVVVIVVVVVVFECTCCGPGIPESRSTRNGRGTKPV